MVGIPPMKDGDRIVIIKRGDGPDGFSLEYHPKSGGIIGKAAVARPLDDILAEIRAEQTRP